MKSEHILDGLKEVVRQLGIEVRSEKGNFRGGRCRVAGEDVIVLNRRHIPEIQISVLAQSITAEEVDGLYMRPALRHALEAAWERAEFVPDADGENE
ncbi:MAG: hypothetical protein ACOCTG_00205 [Bacteroidota bacterium]